MPPPFLEFPSYGRYSMGWRMGSGEGYVMKFGAWLERFCEEDQKIYQNLFPSPITLFDYWNGDPAQTEFPEEYERILSVFEDEALNSDLSSALLSSYMKKRLFYERTGGESKGEGEIKVCFEHDIFGDGE